MDKSKIIKISDNDDLKIWKYAHLFLDTNTLLKLLFPEFKESGTDVLKSYIGKGVGIKIHTCDYCIGEILGILKVKRFYKKNLTTDGYLAGIHRLNWKIDHKTLVVHKLPLTKYFSEVIQIVKKYKIDYIDATLLNYMSQSNKYLFVTADAKLSKAANEFQILCWNILKSNIPPE